MSNRDNFERWWVSIDGLNKDNPYEKASGKWWAYEGFMAAIQHCMQGEPVTHANPEIAKIGCKGTNCGTFGNDHSPECIAEHDACYKDAHLDSAGNRHPEFRLYGYKGDPLPIPHTIDQFNAYAEGVKARLPK